MKRFLNPWEQAALLALLLLFAALVLPMVASAQYGGGYGCSPGYCPPPSYQRSYSTPQYFNTKSAWVYRPWPSDPKFYFHYYTIYDHCGNATNHNDGWLYSLDAHGCYQKHCLIAKYAVQLPPSQYIDPIGRTEVAYAGPEYRAAQAYPVLAFVPGLVAQKDLPNAIDPRSILAPFNSLAEQRQLGAERVAISATEHVARVAAGEQAKDLEQIRGRNALAQQVQEQQGDERFIAEIKEALAVRRRNSVIDARAGGQARAQLNFGNPKLEALIQDRCISCHGPGKADGKLNFANVGPTDKVWGYAYRKCATQQMPKEGEPLTDAELDLFEEQYQLALKSR